MSRLPANTGLHWLKQALALFRRQPGMLTLLLVADLLASLVLSAIPLLGAIAAAVLMPSFKMAVMMGCHQLSQGSRINPSVLLTGFRQPAFKDLCKLGLVYLGVVIVLSTVMSLAVDPAFFKQLAGPVDPKRPPVVAGGDALTMLTVMVLMATALFALWFAAPLTYWQRMPLLKAVFYSVFGVLGAIKPFLTMLLAWFGLFMAGMVMVSLISLGSMTLGRVLTGWLAIIFVLLIQCANYVAYHQIFGDPEAPPDKGDLA